MDGAIKPLLDLDAGMEEMASSRGRRQLIVPALEADGIIIGDHALVFGAQDGLEFEFFWDRPPRGAGIRGLVGKPFLVFGDEDTVEIFGGGFAVLDPFADQLGDQSVLEAAIEALAAAAGLGAVSKDEPDRELRHGSFEVGVLDLGTLLDMGSAVAGGGELAGHVEVEGGGEAEFFKHLIADLEATVAIFVGLELTPEGFSGGVVAAEEQAHFGAVVPEPGMGRAVQE